MAAGMGKSDKYARRLFAIAEPRIFYLVKPKCGCTFVKNVLWFIQTGTLHGNQLRVHDSDQNFLRASELEIEPESIKHESIAFCVVRNPVDRFLSLYLDKIAGPGRKNFVPLAETLIRSRGLISDAQSVADHQYNLELLSEWLQDNLSKRVDLPSNPHWTPQSELFPIMKAFDLKILTVEKLSLGLEVILSKEVPNIKHIIDCVERNRSQKIAPRSELVSSALRRRVNEIYLEDRLLYQQTRSAWNQLDQQCLHTDEVPRFSRIMSSA